MITDVNPFSEKAESGVLVLETPRPGEDGEPGGLGHRCGLATTENMEARASTASSSIPISDGMLPGARTLSFGLLWVRWDRKGSGRWRGRFRLISARLARRHGSWHGQLTSCFRTTARETV